MDGSSPRQPDSDALIRQPGASFQQQGQFDWFALAKSTVSWSVDVIARLSAAGVDQYTALVARNMCHLFKLAPIGRRNMHAALMELACFQSLSDVVWFGIGTKHLVRDLAVTEQGTLCVGLCAGLSSCYSENIAAEILTEMVSVSEAPIQLTPSISEWKKLIHGCNGALHTSSFPRHAERLMSLFPTLQQFTESDRSGPICSLPSSLAKALLAIGDVSRGAVEAITISGGADAGWLAAISEWLFGLHIQILNSNGKVLYASEDRSDLAKKVQVLFLYNYDDGSSANGGHGSKEVQCLERIYYLENATHLFQAPSTGFMEGTITMPRVGGRLAWETALSQAFRPEFKSLLRMRDVMGRAIGAAARTLTAIVRNENKMYETIWQDPDTINKWPRHSDTAHGRGFINSIIYWLPELEPLQEVMEESARLSYSDARSVYETQLSLVQKTCLCNFCRDDFPSNSKGLGFCKVVILETILYLGQMLSAVSADRNLGLKRHGVEAIYELILFNRMSSGPDPSILQEIHGALHFSLCYSDLRQLHFAVLELFAGEAAERPSHILGTSAYSQAGICTYLHILCEVSDSKELVGQIHVTPGRIEYHGRPYDCLQDGGPLAMHMRGLYRPHQTDSQRLKHLELRLKHLALYDKPVMRVKQHTNGLQAWYESNHSKAEDLPVVIQPEEFARAVAKSRGFIDCSGRGGCAVVIPGVEAPKLGEITSVKQLGKVIHIVRGNSPMRCLALNGTQCEFDLLLRSDECIQCCMRAALASSRPRVIIACG